MKFIKTWLKNWIFRLVLFVICCILALIDIIFDLTGYGILSLISIILASVSIIVFLITRSRNDGIRRLLTMVICTGALGLVVALLYDMFYWDIEFLLSLLWALFFLSGTILLLRLVRRKK